MTAYLERAEQIARIAHEGQPYGERSYFEAHILPVVELIRRMGYGPEYQAAGFLHDTIEDGGVTPQFLRAEGIPLRAVTAVELMTKRPGVAHATYLGAIATEPIAVVGKFADSSLNFANSVLRSVGTHQDKFRERILEYSDNIVCLRPLLPDPTH